MKDTATHTPQDGSGDENSRRPTEAQRRYLLCGIYEPGGKLPLFDHEGQAVPPRTIQSCIAAGWAVPWFANPAKPDWLVCKLTKSGYRAVDAMPPEPFDHKDK